MTNWFKSVIGNMIKVPEHADTPTDRLPPVHPCEESRGIMQIMKPTALVGLASLFPEILRHAAEEQERKIRAELYRGQDGVVEITDCPLTVDGTGCRAERTMCDAEGRCAARAVTEAYERRDEIMDVRPSDEIDSGPAPGSPAPGPTGRPCALPLASWGKTEAQRPRRRGIRCFLGLHDDRTDVFGGWSPVCIRCGGPV